MHPFAVLAEIIKARPNFFLFGTINCCTSKASIGTSGWDKLVFALSVSVKIVLGTEAFLPRTVWDFTSVWLFVTKKVLSNGVRGSVRASLMHVI